MDKQAIWDEVRLSLRRAARSDFLEMSATDAERAALAKSEPPLTEEVTQNYAAWRRSVLYASVLILTLGTIFTFVSYESAEDQFARGLVVLAKQAGRFIGVTEARGMVRQYYGVDNLEKLDLIPQAAGLANIAVLILLLLGSRHWARLRKSRRLVRSAWYVLVAVPLLLAIYPWARDLDFRHVPQESVGTFKTTFATAFGMMIFF
ncbi:MAG: hypothetical protein OER88_03485, partial [Planctomycetota bacterium]|nr:hypothetical protein [Planctomycetota bacterium]